MAISCCFWARSHDFKLDVMFFFAGSGALHQWFWRHQGTLQLALRQLAAVPAELRNLESMLPEGNQLEELLN